MQNAQEGTLAKIGDSLRRHPEDSYRNTSLPYVNDLVLHHKKVVQEVAYKKESDRSHAELD